MRYVQNEQDEQFLDATPFYISNVRHQNLQINDFDIFDDQLRFYHSVNTGDLNQDGLDDMLVSYIDCVNECEKEISSIWFNSQTGFDRNNFINVDFFHSGRSYILDISDGERNEIIHLSFDSSINEKFLSVMKTVDGVNYEKTEFLNGRILDLYDIRDINGGQKADVIFLNNDSIPQVLFGAVDMSLSVPITLNLDEFEFMEFYDRNGDNYPDVFVSMENEIKYYENDRTGTFNFQHNFSFDVEHINDFTVTDFNKDGTNEFVITSDSMFFSYSSLIKIFESSELGYQEVMSLDSLDGHYQVLDFDSDGYDDILTSEGFHFFRTLPFHTGLNFDPEHTGHGFSIESVGEDNQFYTVFYTYDNDLYPQWFADLGIFERADDYWRVTSTSEELISFNYDFDSQTIMPNTDDAVRGHLRASQCWDDFGMTSLDFELNKNFIGSFIERENWCSQAIVDYYQRPDNQLSGLWWAGGDDAGWGWSVSLVERDTATDMVVVLYYYYAEGNPRWLIGQTNDFQQGQPMTLDMNMVKGYLRGFTTPSDLTLLPAGNMALTLNEGSKDLSRAGVMSVDVTYLGSEGGHWIRDNIPIALFSNPRR